MPVMVQRLFPPQNLPRITRAGMLSTHPTAQSYTTIRVPYATTTWGLIEAADGCTAGVDGVTVGTTAKYLVNLRGTFTAVAGTMGITWAINGTLATNATFSSASTNLPAPAISTVLDLTAGQVVNIALLCSSGTRIPYAGIHPNGGYACQIELLRLDNM